MITQYATTLIIIDERGVGDVLQSAIFLLRFLTFAAAKHPYTGARAQIISKTTYARCHKRAV